MVVPTDQCLTLYDALMDKGEAFRLRDAGYYTIDALRIEARRRAWGAELTPDDTPLEAGLAYAVAFDKPSFIGREALVQQRNAGVTKRLVQLTLDAPEAFAWGGEPILLDDRPAGEVTSAGYSASLGRIVALGYVKSQDRRTPITDAMLAEGHYAIDIAGVRAPATLRASRS
jgi:4-methylaminobutanoate oxidase (formaldehyde-forming)